jgi:DNA-binding SARP family transcriptional activator
VVADDPWLVLASARRAVAHGRLRTASEAYARAEAAFGVGRGGESARVERSLLRPWIDSRPERQPTWSGLLRAATVRDAAAAAREAPSLAGPLGQLVQGVSTVLAGRPDDGQALLLATADDPRSGPAVAFAATAAAALAPLWGARQTVDAAAVDELAEALGLPWAQRVSAAIVALSGPEPVSDQLRRSFDIELDDWGGALFALHAGLAAVRRGQPALVVLDEASARLRFLGADLLEAWARAALAHALAVEGRPGALESARQAADDARRIGAHGAALMAQMAAAVAAPDDADTWLQRARSSAEWFGLPEPALPAQPATAPPPAAPAAESPSSAMGPVRLRLLGQFSLEVGGHPVDLSAVKPRARTALRLLALHVPRPVHREVLCEALWPEADLESATRNLQVAVSSLRQTLEPGVGRGAHTLVVRDGDAYRLALPEGSDADLVAFEADVEAGRAAQAAGDRRAATEAFDRAIARYGGDLLPEDGPAEWVVGPRDRTRVDAADVAARLAGLALEDGDAEAARVAAERGLRVDRYRDDLWRRLVDAHRARGDQASAARAERDYALVLEELGVS